jgi:hypothetical protein
MALNFPNPSRTYEPAERRIRFWGYDNSREVVFLIDDAVTLRLSRSAGSDESSVLEAFDDHRSEILTLAQKMYKGDPRRKYAIS